MRNLKTKTSDKQNRKNLVDTENKLLVTRGEEVGWEFFLKVQPGDWEKCENNAEVKCVPLGSKNYLHVANAFRLLRDVFVKVLQNWSLGKLHFWKMKFGTRA